MNRDLYQSSFDAHTDQTGRGQMPHDPANYEKRFLRQIRNKFNPTTLDGPIDEIAD